MLYSAPGGSLQEKVIELEVKIFYVFVQGVEGQEAGSVGEVEEGHGERGGCQQVADHQPPHWGGLAGFLHRKANKKGPAQYMVSVCSPRFHWMLNFQT